MKQNEEQAVLEVPARNKKKSETSMQLNDRYFLNPAHLELARARYFSKDESGAPIEEDIDEVFNRVVNYVYKEDTKEQAEEALKLRREKKIVDAGRPLAQAGTKNKNMLNCFVKDTMVSTLNGPTAIQDVVVGDRVVSHSGQVQVVSQVHKNPLKGRAVFNIGCARTPCVEVTGSHRFWAIDDKGEPGWKSVESLNVGDYIAIPKPLDGELTEEHTIDISKYLNYIAKDVDVLVKEHSLCATTHYRNSGSGKTTSSKKHKTVKRMWKVDSDFAFFVGVWLGNGCVFSNNGKNVGITFTTNLKENRLHRFLCKYGSSLFGIDPVVTDNVHQNTKVISFNSHMVGCIFEEMFGCGFDGKHLGAYMFRWYEKLVSALLSGIVTADGTIASRGTCKIEIRNSKLIEQLYHVSRQCGIPVSTSNGYVLYKGEKRITNKLGIPKGSAIITNALKQYEDQSMVRSVIDKTANWKSVNGLLERDGQYFVRLNKKETISCKDNYVYTIGVDSDHSYSVEGLLCENCFVIGFESDTREAISELKRKHFNIQAQGGGTGINFSTLRPSGSVCKSTQSRSSGAVGFITDFSYQSSNISQGGNRCLPGDSLVAMTDGSWKPIIDIRPGDKVLAFDKNSGSLVPSNVVKFYENGVQDVYEYVLHGGVSVKSTETHRWLGVQPDGNLIVRTIDEMPRSRKKVGFVNEISVFGTKTSKWSGMLGYLLGDGCFTGETIKLAVKNSTIRKSFIDMIPSEFSYWENEDNVFINTGGKFQEFLRKVSLYSCVSGEKFIPNEVFLYTKSDIIKIINGLVATDGWVSKEEIGFCSTSKMLVDDFRRLLLKFGISGYIQKDNRPRKGKERNTLWCMRIKHPISYNKFIKSFNVPGEAHKASIKPNAIHHKRREDCIFHGVKEVKNLGKDLTFCIEIDHKDHLFVVDGAVSHNSGANMGVMEDWHPDLYEFISKKSDSNWENIRKFATVYNEDEFAYFQWAQPYPWQMFNVSVFVSDKLINMVEKNEDKPWVLEWDGTPWRLWEFKKADGPATKARYPKTFTVTAPTEEMAYFKASAQIPFFNNKDLTLVRGPFDLTAGEWFEMICRHAWTDGCPGIVFEGLARRYHNGEYFNPIESTNPCVPIDTWVMTSEGPRQVKDLIGKPFDAVIDGRTYRSDTGFFRTGSKELIKIELQDGFELELTDNHLVLTIDSNGNELWKKAGEINSSDSVVLHNHRGLCWNGEGSFDEGYLLGVLVGDGTITNNKAILSTWDKDAGADGTILSCAPLKKRSDFRGWIDVRDRGEKRLCFKSLFDLARKFGLDGSKSLSAKIEKTSKKFYVGFLRGFFDSDGLVQGNQEKGVSVRLWQANSKRLIVIQRMLARLGVKSRIYFNRKPKRLENIKGVEYLCESGHELVISNDSLIEYNREIGFSNTNKKMTLDSLISSYKRSPNREKFNSKVKRVSWSDRGRGRVDVYDVTVNDIHAFDANGMYVHNCAEQFLPRNAVCCLASLILPSFFVDGEFLWDDFATSIKQAVRGLDNVISLNSTGEEDIDANSLNERRIGLGTTAVAELLILSGLKYSSQKGRNFVAKVLEFLRDKAYEASIELAKERGSFPAYEYKGFSQSEFFKTLPEHIQNLIRRYGIRNVTVLTQAPTGTTGTMVGFSTGCEPYFAMCFSRNSRVGSFLDGSPAFMMWLHDNGIDYKEYDYSLAKLRDKFSVPDYFEEAHEISWTDHLKMQAVFAKYIDSSVSKTINLPNSATIDDVKNAYLMAYKLGIKSTTVYRDGSKQQILEHIVKGSDKKRPKDIIRAHAPKRPKELECDIYHTSVKGDKWTVLVGLLDNKPYEVFCASQDNFEIAPKYKKGTLVKNGKGSYYLDTGDFKLKNISSYLNTDEHRVITRLLSTCLRHGVPMAFISDQLTKADGTVVDFSKAVVRVLKKYGNIESFSGKDHVCVACGSKNVIFPSGCPECLDCGVSKCG